MDIELCHFHGSGPIGLQWENPRWPIAQKQGKVNITLYLRKWTYYGPLSTGIIKLEIRMQGKICPGVLTDGRTMTDDDGRVGDSIGSPCVSQ